MKKMLKTAGLAVFFAVGMITVVLGQTTSSPGAAKPAATKAAETAPKNLTPEQTAKVWASWAHVLQSQQTAERAQQELQQATDRHNALMQQMQKDTHCAKLEAQADDSVICVAAEVEKKK